MGACFVVLWCHLPAILSSGSGSEQYFNTVSPIKIASLRLLFYLFYFVWFVFLVYFVLVFVGSLRK